MSSAAELSEAVQGQAAKFDCLIMAAAVSDFRVENVSSSKIKRSEVGQELNLKLVANPDILAETVKFLSAAKSKTLTVGFAAETIEDNSEVEALTQLALSKLAAKQCDLIVANNVANGAVFDSDVNDVLILAANGDSFSSSGTKYEVANQLLDVISDMLD